MTRLEFFESGVGLRAARMGLVNIALLAKYDIYKRYLDKKNKMVTNRKSKLQIRQEIGFIKLKVCEECRCNYSSVVRAIIFFEREDDCFQQSEN